MRSTVVETSPEKAAKCEEFRRLFGIDLRRHGAAEVYEYVGRTGGLRRLVRWLEESLPSSHKAGGHGWAEITLRGF
jgi:hypothetical protein